MEYKPILDRLPYAKPFLFVDQLQQVDEDGAKGSFTFKKEMDFYEGHLKGNPITPGVLLTECCAQIGLVCLGLFLLGSEELKEAKIGMSSADMEFYLPVYPGERVWVSSKKIYFRFHKLKCEVKMHNDRGELVCKGTIAGMIKSSDHG
ncbi:hydroxymyristoyl-ACP dehydratase [Flavobacteriaceae bacterium 3-367]|uniref:3-hydroxyacyl-ACP dehydratase FabZ family protein n=1 Tax=Eudoraea algarum TaxID=3417568 RepID=UPI003277C8D5